MKILLLALFVCTLSFTETHGKTGGAMDKVVHSDAAVVEPDKGDGCGLGWQVTQKRSFLATTTRGTTNGFVPPVFGMTSGTIGCAQHTFAKADIPAATYAFSNYEPLTVEMAEGKGEFLHAFARTLGCGDEVVPTFGRMTQENYSEIVGGKSAGDMLRNVKGMVKGNPVLAQSCRA